MLSCKAHILLAPRCGKTTANSYWQHLPPFHKQRTIYCCNSHQSVSNKPHIRRKKLAREKLLNLAGLL